MSDACLLKLHLFDPTGIRLSVLHMMLCMVSHEAHHYKELVDSH